MVLFSELSVWHLGLIPLVGCFAVLLLYVVFKATPQGRPPQYILEMEEQAILGGRMSMIADAAAKEISEQPFTNTEEVEVKPVAVFRETVNNEVMDEYNDYKRKCAISKEPPKGLTAWLRVFDPDLARRLNDD